MPAIRAMQNIIMPTTISSKKYNKIKKHAITIKSHIYSLLFHYIVLYSTYISIFYNIHNIKYCKKRMDYNNMCYTKHNK